LSFLVILGFTNSSLAIDSAAGLTDPAELEAFMDGLVEAQLEAYHIPGATVAVVKDDALFFAKGYGYADLKKRERVSADRTLFRIASISKLFVWTAVMQLVEQGKLDLNTDINNYLTDFKIPNTYAQPITLTHLMTHTAGFEENAIGLFAKDKGRLLPLGEILARELPARVRPPGEVASYSNHGPGLAALIVETVSGSSWDDFVEKNILNPLSMAHTTFRQPVPEPLSADLSKGYSFKNGEFHQESFVYVPMAPVASASTSATDMARFMLAHLDQGQLGNSRILKAETARQMQNSLFRHAPDVNSMAHGFHDQSRNGQRAIGHGGNLIYFHSMLVLLPEMRVGLFVSYNSEGGKTPAVLTYEMFMDRYFPPVHEPAPPQVKDSKKRLRRFSGTYFSDRRDHHRFTKIGAMLGTVKVKIAEDGVLKTIGSKATRWIETAPLTFREEFGLRTLVFREDQSGNITHMFVGDRPYIAYERVRIQDLPNLHIGLFIVSALLFFTTLVSWPFAAAIRWRYDVKPDPQKRIPPSAYLTAWTASLLFMVVAVLLSIGLGNPNAITFGIPAWIKVMLALSIIYAILTAGTFVYAVVIWKLNRGNLWGRIYYTVVMLALISTLWQLNHWNLIGFWY
jgi:CubicO group peptidase (beta-lactamase class C family)